VTGRKSDEASSSSPAKVVVDAFEVDPQIVSHVQEADPDATYSAGWTQASNNLNWSGSGAFNAGELPPGAKVTEKAGASVTFKFRGTSVSWSGYSGPDAGIALVKVDGGNPKEVDTYSSGTKVQQVVFTAGGLTDAPHTLTIEATGRKNAASSAAKIFVDAFDVTTPGRRHEQGDVRRAKHFEDGDTTITYFGSWNHNDARVWGRVLGDKQSTERDRQLHFHRNLGELDRLRKGECRRAGQDFPRRRFCEGSQPLQAQSDRGIPDHHLQSGWAGPRSA